MQEISDRLKRAGYNPFHLPLGIKLNEVNQFLSQCIRCDTCDGYPCMVHAKADGEVNGILPALHYPNVTLLTGAKVERFHTSESGREVTEVRAIVNGHTQRFKSDLVVVSCGTINSAALLLRSANDKHPNGLANSSDQVGRNFMKHLATALVAFSEEPNPAVYQKNNCSQRFLLGRTRLSLSDGNGAEYGKR